MIAKRRGIRRARRWIVSCAALLLLILSLAWIHQALPHHGDDARCAACQALRHSTVAPLAAIAHLSQPSYRPAPRVCASTPTIEGVAFGLSVRGPPLPIAA